LEGGGGSEAVTGGRWRQKCSFDRSDETKPVRPRCIRSIRPKRARRPFDASVDHTEARKAPDFVHRGEVAHQSAGPLDQLLPDVRFASHPSARRKTAA